MPFRRQLRKRTSAPRRRTASKRPAVTKAVKSYVRRALPRVEMKTNWYHDNEVQLNTLSQGAMQAYPQVNQGTTDLARVGNDINMKSFQIKGVLNNNSTQESYARCLILGHAGSLDPTFSTFPIFAAGASGQTFTISQVNGLDTMYYPINKVETHVYYDHVFKLAGSATGNSGVNTRMFSKFIKFPGKGRKVTFKANATGTGNQNWFISVYWIVADANDDTTTGTTVELSQLTRFWYTDA